MTERGPLPPKLYFRIGEVASLVGVEPHVLRYWEREFRSIRPGKSAKGQRVYSRRDVENLLRVRELLYGQGFTIAGARKRLRDKDEGDGAERAAGDAVAEVSPVASLALVPASGPEAPDANGGPERHLSPKVRAELESLKSEVESFLAELGSS
jgi:DNA-binding transcriptional MerR regulator